MTKIDEVVEIMRGKGCLPWSELDPKKRAKYAVKTYEGFAHTAGVSDQGAKLAGYREVPEQMEAGYRSLLASMQEFNRSRRLLSLAYRIQHTDPERAGDILDRFRRSLGSIENNAYALRTYAGRGKTLLDRESWRFGIEAFAAQEPEPKVTPEKYFRLVRDINGLSSHMGPGRVFISAGTCGEIRLGCGNIIRASSPGTIFIVIPETKIRQRISYSRLGYEYWQLDLDGLLFRIDPWRRVADGVTCVPLNDPQFVGGGGGEEIQYGHIRDRYGSLCLGQAAASVAWAYREFIPSLVYHSVMHLVMHPRDVPGSTYVLAYCKAAKWYCRECGDFHDGDGEHNTRTPHDCPRKYAYCRSCGHRMENNVDEIWERDGHTYCRGCLIFDADGNNPVPAKEGPTIGMAFYHHHPSTKVVRCSYTGLKCVPAGKGGNEQYGPDTAFPLLDGTWCSVAYLNMLPDWHARVNWDAIHTLSPADIAAQGTARMAATNGLMNVVNEVIHVIRGILGIDGIKFTFGGNVQVSVDMMQMYISDVHDSWFFVHRPPDAAHWKVDKLGKRGVDWDGLIPDGFAANPWTYTDPSWDDGIQEYEVAVLRERVDTNGKPEHPDMPEGWTYEDIGVDPPKGGEHPQAAPQPADLDEDEDEDEDEFDFLFEDEDEDEDEDQDGFF